VSCARGRAARAAGLGDIGELFPDTDPLFEGIGGLDLLGRVVERVRGAGLEPASADLTVIAERPAIAPAETRSEAGSRVCWAWLPTASR
jgi:2-C-methyl-D-erythritol 4-phosphate cytidylyltransferase/2-C-methyl-D-erythritol 2,4-cyclodiphosphate synthase